jgi:putative peptidoglycan lipid II flippase
VTSRPGADTSRPDQPARDSFVISICTVLSRATGVLRVVVVGAVLGPTILGNTYQVTNSLPNLIYYGFLAGSLFSSLLVPALVVHIDKRNSRQASLVCGGFLGLAWTALLPVISIAILLLPILLQVVGTDAASGTDQARAVRLLVVLTAPQVFMYAVVGCSTAAMNAHRRFVLASAAPAVENIGVIAVLSAVGLHYGSSIGGAPPVGELVLLGAGSTAAVAVHAGLQWWGAYRIGVTILPRRGWRHPEVVGIIGRSLRSVAQAGLLSAQTLTLLVLASRVAGGSVAMQIGLNFYYLPIALIATPVGLALLPPLSRLHLRGEMEEFGTVFVDGLKLAMFLVIPAAVGYVILAEPLARAVSAGEMNTAFAVRMITHSIVALALGVIGTTTFFVATQAAYARGDTRTPLRSMLLQSVLFSVVCAASLLVPARNVNTVLGAAFTVASLVAGGHLLRSITRNQQLSLRPLLGSLARASTGALVMAVMVWLTVTTIMPSDAGRPGWILTLLFGSAVGVAAYWLAQVVMHAPELSRLRSAVRGHPSPLVDVEEAVRP